MNIVERAGKQLGLRPTKSLVEAAAEQLATTERRLSPAHTVPRQDGEQSIVGARRESRRQVTLDFDQLRRKGFALPGDEAALTEELRLIKRPLLGAALDRTEGRADNANLIMVTSAYPNEGKTFFATNLAISVACERDTHVLLVDGDIVNPSIAGVLGFEAETGLLDLLSDPSIDLADLLIRTNIPNLNILPAGRFRPGGSELLASSRMARLADEMSHRYSDRVVIFDSAPVLARSEPTVLSRYVGQVVLVVEAERTSRAVIGEVTAMLGPNKLTGIVLNKMQPVPMQGNFGYYYGYRSR
jgi:protein-tyrosine kinase